MNTEHRLRYERAVEAARQAAQVAMESFHPAMEVEWKSDQSPVTVADRAAERSLREQLLAAFPHDGVLGEEYGHQPGSSGYRWVIDPIDGTRSFVRGIPLWATLVGLEYQGEPIAGVAAAPALGTVWHALQGHGAFRDGTRIRVSEVATLREAMVCYSSITWFLKAGKDREFLTLATQTQRQRGYGDFYGFVLVAQGSADLMVEHGVHAWDIVALMAILSEAGGRLSNWSNQVDAEAPDVIASNGRLHDVALAILNGR